MERNNVEISIEEYIHVARMSAGRRLKAYQSILVEATELAKFADAPIRAMLGALIAHVRRAIAHDEHTLGLDVRWAGSKAKPQYDDATMSLDAKVDDALVGIRDALRSCSRGLPPEHPSVVAAQELGDELFPKGVNAIIRLPFVEQAPVVAQIVSKLQSPERAPVVAALGLGDRVAYLAELSARYLNLVNLSRKDLAFATVRTARDDGHAYLLEIVATIFGIYRDSRDPAQVAARTRLLAPVHEQQQIVRDKLRAGRRGGASAEDEIIPPEADASGAAEVTLPA